jgi:hypothetical protein
MRCSTKKAGCLKAISVPNINLSKNYYPKTNEYVVSAIFLEKISERKIGTANPQFFNSVRSVN